MKKKILSAMLAGVFAAAVLTGCGKEAENIQTSVNPTEALEDKSEEVEEETENNIEETNAGKEEENNIEETNIAEETENVEDTEKTENTEEAGNLTVEEAEALLCEKYGKEDESTGNTYSFGYENIEVIDGKEYYNFRWSWLVDDHMSYLTNLAVALDGSAVYEAVYDENGVLILYNENQQPINEEVVLENETEEAAGESSEAEE